MKFNLSKEELNKLYNRAKEGYYKCIYDKDNDYLSEELPGLYTSIVLKHSNVKIVFHSEEIREYTIEVEITLWNSSSELVGEYLHIEDDKGNILEDNLVFW